MPRAIKPGDQTTRNGAKRGEDRTPPFFVLKIGGSVFSDKREANSLFPEVLDWYADVIARGFDDLSGRFVLVTGGGSFGHGAVRRAKDGPRTDLFALTEAVFALKGEWAARLRKFGVPAIPLQVSSFAHLDSAGRLVSTSNTVRDALRRGLLPILSGDVVFRSGGGFEILGSDRIPELCFKLGCRPLRVAMLTSGAGIMLRGRGGPRVLTHVDPLASRKAFSNLWSSEVHDVTSGMRGKLEALIRVARQGADCIIAEGRPGKASFGSIERLARAGRPQFPHTRIALSEV